MTHRPRRPYHTRDGTLDADDVIGSGQRWLWLGVAVTAAGAIGAVVAVWLVPPLLYASEDARAALQGGLLTATAGMVVVAGGLVALAETQKANAEVRRVNKNTHVRELYALAVDQVGSQTLSIRLGGLYALKRIATDFPADQLTVVEMLSAFVRGSTDPALRPARPADGSEPPPGRPAADVRAAVQVLAGLPPLASRRLSESRANLTGADLTGPARLAGLDLVRGDLNGVDLAGADLSRANLAGANLTNARLARADLTGATLANADLSANLCEANLAGADLAGANLAGAVGLTQGQLDSARGNTSTMLPEGLARPAHWPDATTYPVAAPAPPKEGVESSRAGLPPS